MIELAKEVRDESFSEVLVEPKRELVRGDIWYVTEDPNLILLREKIREAQEAGGNVKIQENHVQENPRPYLIVQHEKGLESPQIQAAPISASPKSLNHAFIQRIMLKRKSYIHYELMLPIARQRFERYIGTLNPSQQIEMEARLSVPTGQELVNVMAIQYVKLTEEFTAFGETYYRGYVRTCFRSYEFTFSRSQFELNLPFKRYVLDNRGLQKISAVLQQLDGLKFIYKVIKGIADEQ